MQATWHVYLLRARDGSLYTGITNDVERRVQEHSAGRSRGAKSLRGRGPLELAFAASIGTRALALRVEHRLKRLTRAEKERIVARGPDGAWLVESLDL